MKVVCEKYNEEMVIKDAVCRHPKEYCKFRTSCIIHFQTPRLKEDKEEPLKNIGGNSANEKNESE